MEMSLRAIGLSERTMEARVHREGDTIVLSHRRSDRADVLECILYVFFLVGAMVVAAALLPSRMSLEGVAISLTFVLLLPMYVVWATRPRILCLRSDGTAELITPGILSAAPAQRFERSHTALVSADLRVEVRTRSLTLSFTAHVLGVRLGSGALFPLVAWTSRDELDRCCACLEITPREHLDLSTVDRNAKVSVAFVSTLCFRVFQGGCGITACEPGLRRAIVDRIG